ncbi:MAG: alpha/beta fold hydrolase [Bacillota bacterium]
MESIKSKDGTLIAFEKTGEGPPLVLVHGTIDDHSYWEMIQPELGKHFAVYAIDRRGRGKSGDTSKYKLELEYEDIATVIDKIDQPVILLGHSYGGTISLETALQSEKVRKLILYEPQGINGIDESDIFLQEAITKIEDDINEGNNEQTLIFFLESLVGMSSEEIEHARSTPYWKVMVNAAPTLPREMKALAEYKFDSTRFKDLTIPTLLLSGSESPLPFIKEVELLDNTLPNSRVKFLEGQGHEAIRTAPDLFIKKVLEFLRESA